MAGPWPSNTSKPLTNLDADGDTVTGAGGGRDQIYQALLAVNDMLAAIDTGATPYTDSNPPPVVAGIESCQVNTNGTIINATPGLATATASWSGTNNHYCSFSHDLGTNLYNVVITLENTTTGNVPLASLAFKSASGFAVRTYTNNQNVEAPYRFWLMIQVL
jgi:hypothetical protein